MDWSGEGNDKFHSDWRPCVFVWNKRRKLLLMMKTKGCEEKWDFVKSLCKNLIKRTTWNSRKKEEKESWNAEEIQTVNFLLFSLYEKRDFYSNSSLLSFFLCSPADCRGFKMEKKPSWRNTNDILTIFKLLFSFGFKPKVELMISTNMNGFRFF